MACSPQVVLHGQQSLSVPRPGFFAITRRWESHPRRQWSGSWQSCKVRAINVTAQDSSSTPLSPDLQAIQDSFLSDMTNVEQQEEIQRQVEMQDERDEEIKMMAKKAVTKVLGKLKGTQWDPLPGPEIEYSDLRKLLDEGAVRYARYGDYGRHVEVILPHPAEALGYKVIDKRKDATADSSITSPELPQQTIWLSHKVHRMPIDAHNATWQQLRRQVSHVEVLRNPPAAMYPSSLLAQASPTIQLAATWAVRVAVAIALFGLLDRVLFPLYKPSRLEDRPRTARRKLSAALDPNLGTMGQSRARYISAEERTGITFDDFAGQDYVKRELQEVVRILKEAKEFEALGVYCPKGVLLFGPPGTGKTLLAKAIAGEAGVPFFSVSGAEFVEMFAGVAASRVKDLFFRARQFAPAIIFIDEVDAIGVKRGSLGQGDGGIEREQGLIQILTELDGFEQNAAKVLVIGATNRLDMLDPALLRKGRFDKIVRVGLPTEEGRVAILHVHARNKQFRSEEEKIRLLKEVASLTADFSGAELMNVLNEAAILAVRQDRDEILREDLLQAIERQAGEFKTGEEDVIDSAEVRLRAAYKEAAIAVMNAVMPDRGHSFVKTTLNNLDPIPNTVYARPRHRNFSCKQDMVDALVRSYAPALIEYHVFGPSNATWNAAASLREAAQLADYIVLRSGMTQAFGRVVFESQKDLMAHLVPKVVALRDEYMRFAKQQCEAVLREYRSAVDTVAERLLEEGEVTAEDLKKIVAAAPRFTQPQVTTIDELGSLVYEGRWGIHGVSLPGRVTFKPGNLGYATFGAPRPMQVQTISDDTWAAVAAMWEQRIQELEEMDREEEGKAEEPAVEIVDASLFL